MNVCVLYYDGFWEYEVALALNKLCKENVISVALENRVYISEGQQKLVVDKTIDQLDVASVDLFLIPGGDTSPLYENTPLRNFLMELHAQNKLIAGICGGAVLMAKYGILQGKRCTGGGTGISANSPFRPFFEQSILVDDDVVVDGNVITARGQGWIEFAVELGRIVKYYANEEEAMASYRWLKHFEAL